MARIHWVENTHNQALTALILSNHHFFNKKENKITEFTFTGASAQGTGVRGWCAAVPRFRAGTLDTAPIIIFNQINNKSQLILQ